MAEPDYRHLDRWRSEQNERLTILRGGDGGGTFDGMEHRVATLEKSFERVEKKLDGLITDVAEMKGQLKAMPTAIQLLLAVVAIFTASGMLRYFGH